jgi:hypothetical protein
MATRRSVDPSGIERAHVDSATKPPAGETDGFG